MARPLLPLDLARRNDLGAWRVALATLTTPPAIVALWRRHRAELNAAYSGRLASRALALASARYYELAGLTPRPRRRKPSTLPCAFRRAVRAVDAADPPATSTPRP